MSASLAVLPSSFGWVIVFRSVSFNLQSHQGCGRCSARLDGYIVPWVFLSILCALTAPCCIPELWQALTAHLPLARHVWSDCTTHSVTSRDVTDMQRSRSTGCLKTGPVKSSRCYLYPANITGWDFSTSKCPTSAGSQSCHAFPCCFTHGKVGHVLIHKNAACRRGDFVFC